MTVELRGRVLYAHGQPVSGVQVRVFDRDAPGKGDDDLTVEAGVSDADGAFTVRFAPSKYLDVLEGGERRNPVFDWSLASLRSGRPDLTDLYQPYLEFRYEFAGRPRRHTSGLGPFRRDFRLPELPPVAFRPSTHGYPFVNRFPGYFIPFSIPSIPDIPAVNQFYGLCGGMVASSVDFALAGRAIPGEARAPRRATPLHQYIYRRQNDSLGAFGEQVVRFARWMMLPDGTAQGTHKRTHDEFEKIRASLDDGNPVPIGLVYVSAQDTLKIWENHQVLAIGYEEQPGGRVEVRIYDPNHPRRDDVVVRCERVAVGNHFLSGPPARVVTTFGLAGVQRVGDRTKRPVRGFFAMPYVPVTPPVDL